MKYWSVCFHVDATGWIVVKAPTKEEALRIAEEEFYPTRENTELGDPVNISSCESISKEEYDRYVD